MASGPRSVLGWGALAATVAALVTSGVFSALRASARGEIYARLSEYEATGAPLSRDALTAELHVDETTERLITPFLEPGRFSPLQWDPPEGTAIDPYEFDDLVEKRVFTENLTAEERQSISLWLASLEADLRSARSLADEPLGPLGGLELFSFTVELIDVSRALAARAVLAAYEGDVDGVIAGVTDSLAVSSIHESYPGLYAFQVWLLCNQLAVAAVDRAAALLPADADLAVLATHFEKIKTDEGLRLAYAGERVIYLEGLGLLRDGEILPAEKFVHYERSFWRPLSWPPTAEWIVLDDLSVCETLIENGTSTSELPAPARTPGAMRSFALEAVGSANAHAAQIDRLRARLERR